MDKKNKITLGKVQETLLLPLWGRAVESRKDNPKLIDKKASAIIDALDYDFSILAQNMSWVTQLAWVARSLHIDAAIAEHIKKYPRATIINIGCGLDTTFERNDNGQIMFYDLDLPDVMDLRNKFFQESDRRRALASSFLDETWIHQIECREHVLLIAAGVLYYFDEAPIKKFLLSCVEHFPGSELVFDCASPFGVKIANKRVLQDGGMDQTAVLRWGIHTAKIIEQWDSHITVIKEYPMFQGFKEGYSLKMKYGLWMSDILKVMSMVHVTWGEGDCKE